MVSPFDAAAQSPAPVGLTRAEMDRERGWHRMPEDSRASDEWRRRAETAEARVRELEAELVSVRADVAMWIRENKNGG